MIDTSANTVVRTIPTPMSPQYLALSPDGATLYVTSDEYGDGKLSAFTAATGVNIYTAAMTLTGGGSNVPGNIALSPDGGTVYVPISGSSNEELLVVDADTGTITTRFHAGDGGPLSVSVSPDGSRLYVPDSYGSIAVLNRLTGSLITSYSVGINSAYQTAPSPDGQTLYASTTNGNAAKVVDLGTSAVTTVSLGAGSYPYGLAVKDDTTVYVVLGGPGSVAVLTGTAPAPTAPGAPTGLAGTPGGAQVGLSWSAPASNGGSAITDYVVEFKASADSTWSVFSDGTSTATSATVTGLTNGTSYDFRVSAVNSVGTGASSSPASATPTAPAVQAPPSDVQVTGGILQAFVSWDRASGDLGIGAVTYVVSITQGATTFTCSSTGTSCVVLGLAAGAVTADVVATSTAGTSAPVSGSGTVVAASDVASTPPANAGGVAIEFRDTAGVVVTEAVPGQVLTVVATGFAPVSNVDVFIYSVPQHLGTGLTNSSGTAVFPVTVPPGLGAGAHTLVATGFNTIGATASASVAVQVGTLATTGSDIGGAPLVGALMLGVGLLVVLRVRRRLRAV
ncbi:MAG: hypothetical protein BGO95_07675 [Micrococcales bacterium 73-13]|nr:MAG: hypothetical protein BGO95_07675 [Micrococcales bacterium 73-13]